MITSVKRRIQHVWSRIKEKFLNQTLEEDGFLKIKRILEQTRKINVTFQPFEVKNRRKEIPTLRSSFNGTPNSKPKQTLPPPSLNSAQNESSKQIHAILELQWQWDYGSTVGSQEIWVFYGGFEDRGEENCEGKGERLPASTEGEGKMFSLSSSSYLYYKLHLSHHTPF